VRKAKDVPFFRTIQLPHPNESGRETEQMLLEQNVRVCHSYRFAAKKNPTKSFLRVSLSSVNSKTELAKALRLVKAHLRI
jgi:DNA-binding transcriptional MocR family regulator